MKTGQLESAPSRFPPHAPQNHRMLSQGPLNGKNRPNPDIRGRCLPGAQSAEKQPLSINDQAQPQ
jgi:hypothetical protein